MFISSDKKEHGAKSNLYWTPVSAPTRVKNTSESHVEASNVAVVLISGGGQSMLHRCLAAADF